ncbi:hypothetical protein EV360DRAFT_90067, partial [Lentinula raphanica]
MPKDKTSVGATSTRTSSGSRKKRKHKFTKVNVEFGQEVSTSDLALKSIPSNPATIEKVWKEAWKDGESARSLFLDEDMMPFQRVSEAAVAFNKDRAWPTMESQQSLQTMLAQNPQLILQFLQQSQQPLASSSDSATPPLPLQPPSPAASVQHTPMPTTNAPTPPPLMPMASASAPMPMASASAPMPMTSSSAPVTMTSASVPLTMTSAS